MSKVENCDFKDSDKVDIEQSLSESDVKRLVCCDDKVEAIRGFMECRVVLIKKITEFGGIYKYRDMLIKDFRKDIELIDRNIFEILSN